MPGTSEATATPWRRGDTEALERAYGGNPNCPAAACDLLDLVADAQGGDAEAQRLLRKLIAAGA